VIRHTNDPAASKPVARRNDTTAAIKRVPK
jgi:hypothetical protein